MGRAFRLMGFMVNLTGAAGFFSLLPPFACLFRTAPPGPPTIRLLGVALE